MTTFTLELSQDDWIWLVAFFKNTLDNIPPTPSAIEERADVLRFQRMFQSLLDSDVKEAKNDS